MSGRTCVRARGSFIIIIDSSSWDWEWAPPVHVVYLYWKCKHVDEQAAGAIRAAANET